MSGAEAQPAKTGLSPRLIVLLAAFGAIAPVAIDMYLPGVPAMGRDLSVSAQDAGISISIFFIGMALGQLIAGPLSDRLGRRPMIVGGLILFVAGGIFAALAQSFLLLLFARLLQALGACSVTTCSRAAVRDLLEPREAARLFSLLALVGAMIPLIAPMVGNLLLQTAGWRAMFYAMAVVGCLMLALLYKALPESRSHATLSQSRGENALRGYGNLLVRPALSFTLLAASLNSGAMFSYLAGSPAVLMEGFALTPTQFTIVITANSFGLVMLSQFNRMWLKHRQPEDVLGVTLFVQSAIGVVFLNLAGPLAGQLPIFLFGLFGLMCCAALVQVNAMACALSVDPTRSGSTAALFGSVTFAMGALLSWIAGRNYAPDGSGMALVIGLAMVACAISLRIAIPLLQRETAAIGKQV